MIERKILVMGLPGSGKAMLARALAPKLGALPFNADEVRANISRYLGFSLADRIEHARCIGWLCDIVVEPGVCIIADFICPSPETRAAFGNASSCGSIRLNAARSKTRTDCLLHPQFAMCG